jgi:predicted DNA-binding transcriptional regulator AlpA
MQWTVLVEAEAPEAGVLDGRGLTPQQTAAFSRVRAAQGGEASGSAKHWSARVVIVGDEPLVPVHTAEQAGVYGRKLVLDAVGQVGLPEWPVLRVEVVPGLLGVQEAAAALGVSRQRFHQLRQSGRFPVPVTELGSGPVWSRSAVESFAGRWLRSPGPRPARTASYRAPDGTTHQLTATATERTGTVWVPVPLAVTDPALSWIPGLGLPSSPRDGTAGPAVFRVPRREWSRRINEDGTPRAVTAS